MLPEPRSEATRALFDRLDRIVEASLEESDDLAAALGAAVGECIAGLSALPGDFGFRADLVFWFQELEDWLWRVSAERCEEEPEQRYAPEDWQAKYNRARDLLATGRQQKAAVAFRDALRLVPPEMKGIEAVTRIGLAEALRQTGNLARAREELEQVLGLLEEHSALSLLRQLGRAQAALSGKHRP